MFSHIAFFALQKSLRNFVPANSLHVRHVRSVHARAARAGLDRSKHLDDVGVLCGNHHHVVSDAQVQENVPGEHDMPG
jgi:hypothetical protein